MAEAFDNGSGTHRGLIEKVRRRIAQTAEEAIRMRAFTFPPELKRATSLSNALECIDSRWPQDPKTIIDSEAPVFILSAGWRSGSTLMQRLVVSSGEICIWGEPLGDLALLQRLGASISSISHDFPDETSICDDERLSDLANQWIANLTPPIHYLRSCNRTFLKEWLEKPAKQIYGVSRWGLKEVRLTIDHARYLKWLFPNARFIFIYRNLRFKEVGIF